MEYINIISQIEISAPITWPVWIVGLIGIIGVLSSFIYLLRTKDDYKSIVYLMIVGIGSIVAILITSIICSLFFRVPTGRYKYEATIDKDKITVSEYEAFIEEYNPTIKDEIYYWRDKAE